MRSKPLALKGLHTPRPIIFIRGFLDGRFQTAGIDQKSALLNSAYLNGELYLFNAYCKKRVIQLENDLAADRTKAETLIQELYTLSADLPADLPIRCAEAKGQAEPPATLAEAQARRKAAKAAAKTAEALANANAKRDALTERHKEILRSLVEIREKIQIKERTCYEELGVTAETLKARLCVYGHGVLLKQPVYTRYIPALEYTSHLEGYRSAHRELNRKLAAVLQEREG
jgi:hypothetical protein